MNYDEIACDQYLKKNKNKKNFKCPKSNPASDIRFPLFMTKWRQQRVLKPNAIRHGLCFSAA